MIKAKISKEEVSPFSFPKLMVGNFSRNIYLMTTPTSGTIVGNEKEMLTKNVFGRSYNSLGVDGLVDYHGSLTLENE